MEGLSDEHFTVQDMIEYIAGICDSAKALRIANRLQDSDSREAQFLNEIQRAGTMAFGEAAKDYLTKILHGHLQPQPQDDSARNWIKTLKQPGKIRDVGE